MSDVREAMRRELERRERQLYDEQAAIWRKKGWGRAYADLRSRLYDGPGFAPRIAYRVERVMSALDASGPIAYHRFADALAGIDVSKVGPILVETCKDIALIVGGSAVVGGALGGVAGAFAGGVGAVPGAAAGLVLGAQAGVWLLGFLGLASLAEELLDSVPAACREYAWGFRLAWGSDNDPRDVLARGTGDHIAAGTLANGHLLLLGALLEAILAYAGRGRTQSGLVLAEIRSSRRLGPEVADWISANEAALKTRVERLRPPKSIASEAAPPPATQASKPITTAQLRREAEAGGEPPRKPPKDTEPPRDERGPRRAPRHEVPCFKADRLPAQKIPEFDRQLANQQKALNELTVEEYLKGRAAYEQVGRSTQAGTAAAKARADAFETLLEEFGDMYWQQGLTRSGAEAAAQEATKRTMAGLDALHDPDLVVGGKPGVTGLGDRSVNRSIGAQWPKGGRVAGLDEVAHSVPQPARASTRMNATLARCK